MVVTLVTPGQARLSEASDGTAKRRSSRHPSSDATLTDVRCRFWVRKKLALISAEALWRDEEHGPVVDEFIRSSGRFFAYVDGENGLRCQLAPPGASSEVLYLVREGGGEMAHEKMDTLVQCGVIRGDPMESLLSAMQSLYMPNLLGNKSWPDSLMKEFSSQLHKFMATLTDAHFQAKGKTVLYIPTRGKLPGPGQEYTDADAKDKDLVQQLESTLIHWTRQIKEVVNNQDNSEIGEDAGPLAEIEFWRSRSIDLSGIRAQLDQKGVLSIVGILEQAKSSYLGPYLNLSALIQREAIAAEDNLKFLQCLEEPCKLLAKAIPRDIPALMPRLLNTIRMIWNVSRFYNTPEKAMGLLRKVSNEIIARCCSTISLKTLFDGGVDTCRAALQESIAAGEAWKRAFQTTQTLVAAAVAAARAGPPAAARAPIAGTPKSTISMAGFGALSSQNSGAAAAAAAALQPWDFETSGVFAHVDAFMQRCRDLLEVCDAQAQFAGRVEMPAFGGTRGPEISKSLVDIQAAFQKLIANLRDLEYNILDVKVTRWHDDFNAFKGAVKDLEVLMQNVINLAFESAGSLGAAAEALDAFQTLAKRDAIVKCVERKTSEVYTAFLSELSLVKKQFDQLRRKPPVDKTLPRYAGAAMWALGLQRRIARPMAHLNEIAPLLARAPELAELQTQQCQVVAAIEQFIKNQHLEWFNQVGPEVPKRLENTLIVQDAADGGLVVNFDRTLLNLFHEVHYWERLGLEIPYVAMEIAGQREKYRVLRENVLLVVRDYNKILGMLNSEEKRLFVDRIRYLDKKISPGLNKLNWIAAKNHLEYYVKEARRFCAEVEATVGEFKASSARIQQACKSIGETLVVHVEKKKVYESGEFEAKQKEHRQGVRARFEGAVADIRRTMESMADVFAGDSDDVHAEWVKYTHKVDKLMEDALRQTVKRSLQELSRALNGDAKTDVTPIFNTLVALDRSTGKVELRPSLPDLVDMIHAVCRESITVITVIPRLAEPFPHDPNAADGAGPGPLPSFYELISTDEDTTLKVIVAITSGMSGVAEKVQGYLGYWEKKYKHIWEQDKEAYIRRYEKAKKPLSAFEADIQKYKDLTDEIAGEDSSATMRFLRVECGPLKQAMTQHCEQWTAKFTALLNSLARAELESLQAYFAGNTVALSAPPVNLDVLAESVNLWKKLVEERASVEARFEPLQDKYKTLEKFEVSLSDSELAALARLPGEWAAFQATLQNTEKDIEVAKDNFREKLVKIVDGFVKDVAEQRADFGARLPTSADVSVEEALRFIAEEKAKVEANQKRAKELKSGMDIFAIEQPAYKETAATLKDLELLEGIWGLKKEWQDSYSSWKDGQFKALDVAAMEAAAQQCSKRVTKLGRDIKTWSVWSDIRDTIDAFKKTMPLIIDLRNPAMRPRHWQQLMDAVGAQFDPNSAAFTLAKVTELRLDMHAELVGELSTNSSKEMAIEQSLAGIAAAWTDLTLDMVPYKETHKGVYKLRGTEDVFAALEDNTVTLSTMKASRFYLAFEKELTYWEKSLAHVSNTIEMILQVQRQWMYLENIFVGSEDIRKQLPGESAMFDSVNTAFVDAMKGLYDTKNVLKGTTAPGVLEGLNDMDRKLERIQKSLENYLEKKRQQFPRFYFLSSDDLLEILGQAKDPLNVQPHLKKCFEGIKKLEMHTPGADGRRHTEATGIFSPDGEYLPFSSPVITESRPEEWLNKVEAAMFATTKKHLFKTLEESRGSKKEKWLKDNPGQCVITAGQIVWTNECERALADPENSRAALKLLKKKWVSYLNKLTAVTRSKLSKIDRLKTVSLITIEVHARDVIEKLGKVGCSSPNDFEWASQLRFYWDKDANDCIIKQVLSVFVYGYEYQGNNGRLVITPLTDRCYMTLGAALFTRRGGNPLGPAGTGKTETVKDFGKALARYVIVFNCSDGVDYKMTGKMFSGLAQTGAWACLDEFNRIEVEVLSVVASQISCVMGAIKAGVPRFVFEGTEIRLIPTCGIFVTMNPGYAGRSELPDNLKAMLRPVSMMVPDFTLIAEIMMFSEGFQSAKILAKKMIAIMELSQQQLSKQDHYDYGLRSFVIPISRAAGAMKRTDPDASEEVIMYRTMKDLIMPKLVYTDLPLFMSLLSDLFPGVEIAAVDGGALRRALEEELLAAGLQVVPAFITKIIQIYDCKVARHGNMIVGKTGSGKSEAWKCLTRAMARLKKEGLEDFERVHVYPINPLALSNNELYGAFDEATHEWTDGILARIMREVCKDESADQKWILFDGPVDTLWIESMNTLLDDNKLLTLLSGERISMPAQVSILFEVEDLSQASPATVSRAGMIYLNVEDLGWWPYVTSWLQKKQAAGADQVLLDTLKRMMEKYVDATSEFRRRECRETVPIDRLNGVVSLCTLFDALATPENGVAAAEGDHYVPMIELWFLFSLIWSLGASVDEDGRKKFDMFLKEQDARFPTSETVYEYFVDPKRHGWAPWEEKLSANFRPAPDAPFFKIVVPTVDTRRTEYVLRALVLANRHALVVGNVGVGKTLIVQGVLGALPEGRAAMTINFSAQTSSNSLQDTIEGRLEKRTKGVFAPAGGKRLACFIDDLNMPKKSQFGFMPPLELLKLWVDNGFWYDRQKQEVKQIKDMQLLAAMAPPGGGRNAFSQRVQACFSLVNVTTPSDAQLKRIFGTMVNAKLADFADDIKPMGDALTQASIEVYNAITAELLPTPSKSHYLFNIRDLAKVVQGLLQASRGYYDSKESMLQLWCHECFRIFGDRMWDKGDKAWLQNQLNGRLIAAFSTDWKAINGDGPMQPFVSFMRPLENPPYEPVADFPALKEMLQTKMEDYGLEPGAKVMDLVLFRDALEHVCRIHRVLMQPRGNALLVGVGGSGRKSLARLAAYVAELKVFSIEIVKNYRATEFHEDLKTLYRQAGAGDNPRPTVFLFDDTQIVTETFLEDVNNILTSGEVPNLFTKDEIQAVCEECRGAAKRAGAGETGDALYAFFLERVRANLHVVLCLSPVGEAFRNRLRMFPGLVNCTTIDWFIEWPADALLEVATKLLEEEKLGAPEVKAAICQVFVTAHQSVQDTSAKMKEQLKRQVYVTPTNYLEFAKGYRQLLKEKNAALGESAGKLRGGLQKLDETREQVGAMQVVCVEKKVVVAKAKKDCEELLVEIVTEKRAVDEQERQVNAEASKIEKEAEECNAIATDCQRDLDKALPALQAAEDALNVLTKKDLSEVKAYAKPPPLVELALGGVMTVLKKPTSWDEIKKALGDASFLEKLLKYDKDQLVDSLLKKITKYTSNPDFTPEAVGKVSAAAKGLCLWVRAMETYGYVSKEVGPKKEKLKAAQATLAKKQAALQAARDQLAAVLAKVAALKDKYDTSTASKEALQREAEDLEGKLQRAEKLVLGLAGEKSRWEASIGNLEQQIGRLPGDCLVAAAFLSYAGPFPSEYREELVKRTWLDQVRKLSIPSSADFDFALFLANPSDVRDWNIQGLPADQFSTENGVMVTRGRRWPLMIDPQGQANKWVKSMEAGRGLKVVDLQMSDLMRTMENAIQFGNPVLLQDVLEEIDPSLEPILAKSFVKKGNQVLIKLGDKEIDYNPDFRLYITTKLANPHYTPEVSTKATIVNFAVKEQGLEAQLLNTVVQKERPDLDKQKNELVVKVATGKRTQAKLEDDILRLLSSATGSLLDNLELINTLDQSKTTWEEVNESLKVAEETAKKIETAAAAYKPCAVRASALYFVLNELATIDPMYQFSLDAYTDLFHISIAKSPKSDQLQTRIKNLNDFHTYAVYKYTARGLFERHKLLLSLQICARILQTAAQINTEEWQFFLRGGTVLDRSAQPKNPARAWISEQGWDHINELEKLPHFKGVVSSFDKDTSDWEAWYRQGEPETAELPGEWESKCNELQRMIFVRCLRPDRVIFAAATYVAHNLGRKFVEPPVLDLGETYNDSLPTTPLVFVLSAGVDPTANLRQLAANKGMADKFHAVALGQGQAPIATKLIQEAVKEGNWVFLANCHLMTSWLPTLDKIIEGLEAQKPHESFRLWLSSSPNPKFPISILQRGLKMTTEPPKGLRANLLRLYASTSEESWAGCRAQAKYQKLFFALTYFHSVLLERKKFGNLGLNIPYDFNDTDFQVSDDLLKTYLDEYDETPFDALKYLIAEANYGGRVTDELDRRVLASYLDQFYCPEALATPAYPLSSLPNYYIPDNGTMQTHKEYLQTLPVVDRPEAFGQHPNADISFQINDTRVVLESIVSLQPRASAAAGGLRREDIVMAIATDLLSQVPEPMNLEDVQKFKKDDPSALHVVLFQEIERYNALLRNVRASCANLQKGIKGLVVMSSDLDAIFAALFDAKVPPAWLKCYPSLKPLGPWTRDLVARVGTLRAWAEGTYPNVYWLSGFTYPTGFLTAVLQTTARRNAIPIDTLGWEFSVVARHEKEITEPPKEGVYIKGMYLEGAGWDHDSNCLCEPEPMELIVPMPIMHFKPVENKRKTAKGVYACPLYMYPLRTGTRERPSYMISVDLRAGTVDADHWVKRGTALLLSLAT